MILTCPEYRGACDWVFPPRKSLFVVKKVAAPRNSTVRRPSTRLPMIGTIALDLD